MQTCLEEELCFVWPLLQMVWRVSYQRHWHTEIPNSVIVINIMCKCENHQNKNEYVRTYL